MSLKDADIGRKVGFQRIAVHHLTLPPGERTSSPHPESLEEEFVFVLKGQPHLWLNGFIHDLKEGHAVGFPAGTGIAHSFINNTVEEIHLLVAREKTKPDSLCAVPSGIFGPIRDSERATGTPDCVVYCPEVEGGKPFHYPGDNETFGRGFRITNKVGLKALGIWYERLPAGRRSSFPHAHTHEEEFVFVLQGRPTVWMDGVAKTAREGDFAAFPSATGIAHTIINETDDEVIYLCIGETQEFKDEKIVYPLNPLRNSECERKGWFWKDAPRGDWGGHPGKSKIPYPDHLAFRLSTEADAAEILKVFAAAPDYFMRIEGCLPTEKTVLQAIADRPKKMIDQYVKEFLLIEHEGRAIGVLDLHAHHPEAGVCYIGLLLIEERLHGKGLGSKCYLLAEDYCKRAFDCKTMRIGISDDNEVSKFWLRFGFAPNGRTYEWKGEEKTSNVREFDKSIAFAPGQRSQGQT